MRLRNESGTVVSVNDETAKRLQATGWKSAEASSTSTQDSDEETAKPKRRTRRGE